MIWSLLGCAPSVPAAQESGVFFVAEMAALHVELVRFQQDGTDPALLGFTGVLAEAGDTEAPFNAVLQVEASPCSSGAIAADVAIGGLLDGGAEGPWEVVFNGLGDMDTVGCPQERARGEFEGTVQASVDADGVEVFGQGTFGGTPWTVESSNAAWVP